METYKQKLKKARKKALLIGSVTVISLVCCVFAMLQKDLREDSEKANALLTQQQITKLTIAQEELKKCQNK